MTEINKFLSDVDSFLFEKFSSRNFKQNPDLCEMLRYQFKTGGKRLRPLAALAIAEHCAQELSQQEILNKTLPFAIAVEIIHNATLVHDDLQDGDEYRRGQETLWRKYSPEQAINSGDYLFFLALECVQEASYSDNIKLELLKLLQKNTKAVIEGQVLELQLKEALRQSGQLPSLQDYFQVIEGKTAALFSLPFLGAAEIFHCKEDSKLELAKVSLALGCAFQIQDDLVDIWGSKGREQIASDIYEGKVSFLVAKAVELWKFSPQAEGDLQFLLQIINSPREETKEDDVRRVIQLFEDKGIKQAALEQYFEFGRSVRSFADWKTPALKVLDELDSKVKSL